MTNLVNANKLADFYGSRGPSAVPQAEWRQQVEVALRKLGYSDEDVELADAELLSMVTTGAQGWEAHGFARPGVGSVWVGGEFTPELANSP